MELLRKIDCYGQLVFASLALSIPFLFGDLFLAGLLLLGCWQLLSAIANTHSFIKSGLTKRIYRYWTFCIVDLIMLFMLIGIGISADEVTAGVLFFITLVSSVAIAAYYWWIYFKFIQFLSLRNELDGLTKSKH